MNASTRTDHRREHEEARKKLESNVGLSSIKQNFFVLSNSTDFICEKNDHSKNDLLAKQTAKRFKLLSLQKAKKQENN